MAQQTVTLQPGESKQVSFEAIPHEAKTYNVKVNGLTGSFVVIAATKFYMPPQMTVEVTNGLILAQYWKCLFSVVITNKGETSGTRTITSVGSGPGLEPSTLTEKITLAPGQSYTFRAQLYVDFRQVPSYKLTLTGDWEEDNYSSGEATEAATVLKPSIQVGDFAWDRVPAEYEAGTLHTANMNAYNNSTRMWNYTAILYIGQTEADRKTFRLEAGQTQNIRFSVITPKTAGIYPVYLDILADSTAIITQKNMGSITIYPIFTVSGTYKLSTFESAETTLPQVEYSVTGNRASWTLAAVMVAETGLYGATSKNIPGTGKGVLRPAPNWGIRIEVFAHPMPNKQMSQVEWEKYGSLGWKKVKSFSLLT